MFPWMIPVFPQLLIMGFWSLLAKGALGLGSTLLGNKLGKVKPTAQENQVLNSLMQTQQQTGKTGQNLVGMGQQSINQPLNYYSSLLSGNKGDVTSALAPELNRISEGYQNARQTASELMPRGGARASQLGALPFQQQREQSTLMQQVRPQAAGQLGGLAGQLLQSGIGAINASTSAGRDILNQQQRMRELEAERGKSIGGGLFDLIQKFGFPAIDEYFKKRAGDSSKQNMGG